MLAARILIGEEQRLVAEVISRILEPHFEICGLAMNGRALISLAKKLKPKVVVLPADMLSVDGLDVGEAIKQSSPSVKLVCVTSKTDPVLCAEALRRGASAYIAMQSTPDELIKGIRAALTGATFISPHITKQTVQFLLSNSDIRRGGMRISNREGQVLDLLAKGYTLKATADTLRIRPGTVAYHKYKMMEALGVRSTAELLRYAFTLQTNEPGNA
jgi:DNA-binding NarL/FixJ family response regulator